MHAEAISERPLTSADAFHVPLGPLARPVTGCIGSAYVRTTNKIDKCHDNGVVDYERANKWRGGMGIESDTRSGILAPRTRVFQRVRDV